MKKRKRQELQSAGWRVGGVREFLGLSQAEAAFVEIKLALAACVRARRMDRGLSQAQVAQRIGSSQSRVAKMEAGDPAVSMDLLVRTLLAIGARRAEVARAIGRRPSSRAA